MDEAEFSTKLELALSEASGLDVDVEEIDIKPGKLCVHVTVEGLGRKEVCVFIPECQGKTGAELEDCVMEHALTKKYIEEMANQLRP